MAQESVESVIKRLVRDNEFKNKFKTNPDNMLDHFDLTDEERKGLKKIDLERVEVAIKELEDTMGSVAVRSVKRAERALQFPVLWRKRSNGTHRNKGNRWVERILTLKQTCRMRAIPNFPILVNANNAYFKEQIPDLQRIAAN